ncbi:P-loop containing nucleoside triphosphate hydrolases superfamily protein isoform 1 [Dorcoceras hygrometricum]|uniref:P-loop containing nucleoside triphosphate hydrolases superfamily protein isoform 1 n=1 Tax=Dorcoceras hygrometricum TaxID=472368 RepID=A0A2Z7C2E1_9LAMI|nr:P-loop containing nucleoside triphosphate hydrolases superfamily protein isoform 1 [Dorcoceras hygrometricum]
MSFSTTTLPHFHPFFSSANGSQGTLFASISPSSYRLCGCPAENCGNAVSLAWVVMKEVCCRNIGSQAHRVNRLTTLACNLDGSNHELPVAAGNDGDVETEIPKPSVQRRRGGGGIGVAGGPDLLAIPGVGPRNLRKLVDKGFEGVIQLKQLYKDKFYGKSSHKMVEFLQSSVGIIHKNHAESITSFIKESVDAELNKDGVIPAQKKRITLCVEGNISVGKTTFLQRVANETLELRDLVEIVPEPVDKWQNVGPDQFNILDAFYAEPERYAYTFQNYVFVTRVMQEKESSDGIKPLRLMERSVFSDRMVFVRAVHEAKWMNEMEISIYESWFDPVVSSLPGLIPDGFIYLRASPDTCHKRMMLRKRAEEGGVSLDYLRDLHEKHESWLFPFQSGHHGVLSVSKLPNNGDRLLHPKIQDRVFYLDGNHMHSSIQKVPALVLDCEPDIDFGRDIEAKREYACQVAEFFEFVKNNKEASTAKVGKEDSAKRNQPQVLLPCDGKLWMPGAPPFPNSPLKSMQFIRPMSCMPQ